jgi:hypothetical protein
LREQTAETNSRKYNFHVVLIVDQDEKLLEVGELEVHALGHQSEVLDRHLLRRQESLLNGNVQKRLILDIGLSQILHQLILYCTPYELLRLLTREGLVLCNQWLLL